MTNARFASSTVDPEDTASSLRAKGRVLGFERTYIHPRLASLSVRKGTLSLGTGVELLDDPVYAVQYLHARLTDYERLRGRCDPGSSSATCRRSRSPASATKEAASAPR